MSPLKIKTLVGWANILHGPSTFIHPQLQNPALIEEKDEYLAQILRVAKQSKDEEKEFFVKLPANFYAFCDLLRQLDFQNIDSLSSYIPITFWKKSIFIDNFAMQDWCIWVIESSARKMKEKPVIALQSDIPADALAQVIARRYQGLEKVSQLSFLEKTEEMSYLKLIVKTKERCIVLTNNQIDGFIIEFTYTPIVSDYFNDVRQSIKRMVDNNNTSATPIANT